MRHHHTAPSRHVNVAAVAAPFAVPAPAPSRFASFSDAELAVIQYAVESMANDLYADTQRGDIDPASLPQVGGDYAVAMALAAQIDNHFGAQTAAL
jgi:hypothetical protein